MLFTPGFSPVITMRKVTRNRFNGFQLGWSRNPFSWEFVDSEEEQTVETVLSLASIRDHRAQARCE